MNSLNVKSLNECFNVDGPDLIEDDINSHTHTHTHTLPSVNKGMKGFYTHSEEIKRKMSKANKNSNIKYHYTIYSIKENKTYETNSLKAFCKEHLLNHGNLYYTLTGERNHHKGFKIILKEPLQDACVPV